MLKYHANLASRINMLAVLLFTSQLAMAAVCDEDPMSDAAPFSAGNGTEENPYVLCSPQQFNEIGVTYLDKHFVVGTDISFTNAYSDKFIMIGSLEAPFTGSFDGKSHTLNNIHLVSSEALQNRQHIGVFRHTQGATIKNLAIEIQIGSKDAGVSYEVGGLIGHGEMTTIDNIVVNIKTQGSNRSGGLAGYLKDSLVSNVKVSGLMQLTQGNDAVGGLVGRMENTTVEAAHANMQINGTNDLTMSAIGGLIGIMSRQSQICNSYYTGGIAIEVPPTEQFEPNISLGGLVGTLNFSKIQNSYFNGTIDPDAAQIGVITNIAINSLGSESVFWNQDKEANPNSALGQGIPEKDLQRKQFMKPAGFSASRWHFKKNDFPTLKYVNKSDLECSNS